MAGCVHYAVLANAAGLLPRARDIQAHNSSSLQAPQQSILLKGTPKSAPAHLISSAVEYFVPCDTGKCCQRHGKH